MRAQLTPVETGCQRQSIRKSTERYLPKVSPLFPGKEMVSFGRLGTLFFSMYIGIQSRGSSLQSIWFKDGPVGNSSAECQHVEVVVCIYM